MTPHRIDTHHHILPPKYVEKELDRIVASSPSFKGMIPAWTPQKAIDAMDASGTATAVTSISAPGIWFGDRQRTRQLARECNEFAAEMGQRYKNRFGLFAVLPLPNVDDCLTEIESITPSAR
jgi:hypothetical protein